MQTKHSAFRLLNLNSHVTNLGENKRHKLEGTDKDLTIVFKKHIITKTPKWLHVVNCHKIEY